MQIRWELLVAFVVAGLLTVASVLVFAVFIARKTGASWKYWLYGAVVFIVFQGVLRLPWLIPLNILLRNVLRSSVTALIGFTAFAALTAALFERGGQWVLFRKFVRPEERTAANALMIGAGHGGRRSLLHRFAHCAARFELPSAFHAATRIGQRSRTSHRSSEGGVRSTRMVVTVHGNVGTIEHASLPNCIDHFGLAIVPSRSEVVLARCCCSLWR